MTVGELRELLEEYDDEVQIRFHDAGTGNDLDAETIEKVIKKDTIYLNFNVF
jgi:hypothetical protein